MNSIAVKLKLKIKERGMSIRELEKATGIPHSAIQRYASGRTDNIPISRLKSIASALGTTAEYLLGWDEDIPTIESLSDVEKEIIITLRSFPSAKIDNVLNYIRFVASQN